jgi:two-component system sensor histidine kinase UhpB
MRIEPHGLRRRDRPHSLRTMLRHICVAFNDTPPARWALEVGTALALAGGARLTVAYVEPPMEHGVVDLDEAGRGRRVLPAEVAALPPELDARACLLSGRAAEQLAAYARAAHVDLLVAGTRPLHGPARVYAPRLRHELLGAAPCPVALVRHPPRTDARPCLVAAGEAAGEAAATLATALGAALVLAPADELASACEQERPLLAIIGRERCHALRRRLGASAADALIGAAGCPVVVAPMVSRMPSASRRRSLLRQLFVAEAAVLVAALAVLVLAPIQVSTTVVVTEVLVLSAGLAVMLAVHLLVLRRTLAPLQLLTSVIASLDARDPGRLPAVEARTEEVDALAAAFNGLLDRLDEERRRSARRALIAQEEERLRIAREMHDQIGQTLTALTIQAERLAEMDQPVDPRLLRRIAQAALQSLEDVRRIGRELRPEALDDLGLGNALIALCRRMSAPTGVRVAHALEPGLPPLAPEVELVIYRIAQEAVTNALRHSGASEIRVALRRAGGAVELTVADDGRGMPAELPAGTAGISGMRERAALVGGELHVGGVEPGGTEVRLTVPATEAAAA